MEDKETESGMEKSEIILPHSRLFCLLIEIYQ